MQSSEGCINFPKPTSIAKKVEIPHAVLDLVANVVALEAERPAHVVTHLGGFGWVMRQNPQGNPHCYLKVSEAIQRQVTQVWLIDIIPPWLWLRGQRSDFSGQDSAEQPPSPPDFKFWFEVLLNKLTWETFRTLGTRPLGKPSSGSKVGAESWVDWLPHFNYSPQFSSCSRHTRHIFISRTLPALGWQILGVQKTHLETPWPNCFPYSWKKIKF